MDRREFLQKLTRWSFIVGGLAVIPTTCRCYSHDDYADRYCDYQDYCDFCDSPYGEWYCDGLDYCNHPNK